MLEWIGTRPAWLQWTIFGGLACAYMATAHAIYLLTGWPI